MYQVLYIIDLLSTEKVVAVTLLRIPLVEKTLPIEAGVYYAYFVYSLHDL